jgi:UDPglucose 6-dehydrogenase
MSRPVVGYAGMTHLGINSAAAAAARGFRTVCYDADAAVIAALGKGKPPVLEPGLAEALKKNAKRLVYSSSLEALAECDLVYIATDVATDDSGASDLAPIQRLIRAVQPKLGRKAILVVLCQVPPGFTRGLGLPAQTTYYQVETLVFGRAYERALNPERFILGCADPAKKIPGNLATYLRAFRCPILPMRYESAELAKIAINCCLVSSISVANTLAELCERIGADWSEIVPSLKLDARIGPGAYLAPGLGIAGGNLERDLATVVRLAGEQGTDAGVVKAWVANSRHRRDWAARTIRSLVLDREPAAVIAVWGLAYKENTHSVKNSPSLATIAQLGNTRLRLHDPAVTIEKHEVFQKPIEAAQGADALMILTPWPQYRAIAPAAIRRAMRGSIVLDPYAVLDRTRAARAGLEVHTLGRHA